MKTKKQSQRKINNRKKINYNENENIKKNKEKKTNIKLLVKNLRSNKDYKKK